MQRASAVAALGRILAEEGMAKKSDEFELIYLRKSQAEREREERLAKEEEQK
jgi:tRNA threonylcarbamoyladenosine biosynthesis protein TsaB